MLKHFNKRINKRYRRPYGGFALAKVKLDLSGARRIFSVTVLKTHGKIGWERERNCMEFARRVLVSNLL